MTDDEIQQLDYASVLDIVFPNGPVYLTPNNPKPKNWCPWQMPPGGGIAIDNNVDFLNRRRKDNEKDDRLCSPEQLKKPPLYILCPFHFGRHAIALAAELARVERINRAEARSSASPDRWQRIHDNASDLAAELRKFVRPRGNSRVSSVTPHPYFLVDGPDITGVVEQKRSAAIESLESLMSTALSEKKRLAPPHRDVEVWKTAFVISLCYSWRALTGSDPNHGRFIEFLDAAYASLGSKKNLKWDTQIKRAIARDKTMPVLQRFNWYEQSRG